MIKGCLRDLKRRRWRRHRVADRSESRQRRTADDFMSSMREKNWANATYLWRTMEKMKISLKPFKTF